MNKIIGRKKEQQQLLKLSQAKQSVFLAIYGRRRVGKTYLIRTFFKDQFDFYASGVSNVSTAQQLAIFHHSLIEAGSGEDQFNLPKDWFEAFGQLKQVLSNSKNVQKRIFLDELPWLDTPRSNFIPALEHFWNTWASARNDIMLIVCGSAASWIINKLISNKGPLYNSVTDRIDLSPFNLQEAFNFLKAKGAPFDCYQIVQLYMVMGGIPFYLDKIDIEESAIQNINKLCFERNGILNTEFNNLYRSLFKKAENHLLIVHALTEKNKGLTRAEIAKYTGIPSGGGLTRVLNELEQSNFIRRYLPFGKKKNESLYQLIDFYSLFYLKFIEKSNREDTENWISVIANPKHRTWSEYAFKLIGLMHIDQIKENLGISGVQTTASSWIGSHENNRAQIDLVIDRRDQIISICEFKFSFNKFTIDKQYAEKLKDKIDIFKAATKTRKAVNMAMITTYGITENSYSRVVVNKDLKMGIFFE